jgi:hypothetical protein
MTYTPGWSVGWFFVPLANLVMPYLVIREIWQASGPGQGANWRRAPVSAVLSVWWVVGVVGGMSHYTPFRILLGKLNLAPLATETFWLGSLLEDSWFLLVSNLVAVAIALLDAVVVLWITAMQDQKSALDLEPVNSAVSNAL